MRRPYRGTGDAALWWSFSLVTKPVQAWTEALDSPFLLFEAGLKKELGGEGVGGGGEVFVKI